jgi:hypothetical protein
MVVGLIPPTTTIRAVAGRAARMAAIPAGGTNSAGKIFRAVAPSLIASKASVGVMTPWTPGKRQPVCGCSYLSIQIRGHDELTTAVFDVFDIRGFQDRARADYGSAGQLLRQDIDRPQRVRRIQRYLDDPETSIDQDLADGRHLRRFNAAQNCN